MSFPVFLVPIFTLFKDDFTVDYGALHRLVRKVLDDGADGIYAGGSSAEFVNLTFEERRKTLETVVRAADGAYVAAHIGSSGTDEAVALGKHAASLGVNCLASVPPFYYAYTFEEVKKYYSDIYEAAGLPVIVYSLLTLGSMSLRHLTELLSLPGNFALKYTQSDYYILERLKEATGKPIFSGRDECFAAAYTAGADGAIGTTMNFAVGKFADIKKCLDEGDVAGARSGQRRLNNIIQAILETGSPMAAMKYAYVLLGGECPAVRRPNLPLTEEEKRGVAAALKENM